MVGEAWKWLYIAHLGCGWKGRGLACDAFWLATSNPVKAVGTPPHPSPLNPCEHQFRNCRKWSMQSVASDPCKVSQVRLPKCRKWCKVVQVRLKRCRKSETVSSVPKKCCEWAPNWWKVRCADNTGIIKACIIGLGLAPSFSRQHEWQ